MMDSERVAPKLLEEMTDNQLCRLAILTMYGKIFSGKPPDREKLAVYSVLLEPMTAQMAKNNGQGGVTGTLMQLGKAAVNSRMPVQAFRGGRQRLRELNDPMYRQRQELYREAKAEEAQKVSKKSDAQQSMEAVQAELNKSDMQAMKKKIEANLPKK